MLLSPEPLPEYTRSQLALRNGQDKPQVWVAFRGIIYDVTESSLWRTGQHYEHWEGQDVHGEMEDDPHGARGVEGFNGLGRLLLISYQLEVFVFQYLPTKTDVLTEQLQ